MIIVCLFIITIFPVLEISASEIETLYSYEIVASYPHDPEAFVQGLVYYGGYLYESTGLYGQSSLRRVKLLDGEIQQITHLPPSVFGEGITIFNDLIIQLTWREGQGYVYDLATFDLLQTFKIAKEGWGLTNDGEHLIMSDGTSMLSYLDPQTFAVVHQIEVVDSHGSVKLLNELEYINGEIYANVWLSNHIVRINPANGQVIGWIDLSGLMEITSLDRDVVDVLNGIAYDDIQGRLFVTGKLWPRIYEIRLVPQTPENKAFK